MNRIRQEQIKKYIESRNVATIKELRELFPEVSLMTLHRDLSALEEMGIVTKYRGGVRSVRQPDDVEFNIRMKENTVGKMSMMKKKNAMARKYINCSSNSSNTTELYFSSSIFRISSIIGFRPNSLLPART